MSEENKIKNLVWRTNLPALFEEVLKGREYAEALQKPFQISMHVLARYVTPAVAEKNYLLLCLLSDLGILRRDDNTERPFYDHEELRKFCEDENSAAVITWSDKAGDASHE